MLHTLPSNASLFFLNRIWDINLCTMNGIVIGIHIEPTIHHNIFQLELLILFATGFILILEFPSILFQVNLFQYNVQLNLHWQWTIKVNITLLCFFFDYFSLVSLLSKRVVCVCLCEWKKLCANTISCCLLLKVTIQMHRQHVCVRQHKRNCCEVSAERLTNWE